jgi:p-cumate 2,3-dioxygenase ferredoxin component
MAETTVLCAAEEVLEGEIKQTPLTDATKVALYRGDGAIHATADMCTHGAASLSDEGIINGKSWNAPSPSTSPRVNRPACPAKFR